MKNIISNNRKRSFFDSSYYGSDEWGAKANSTARLMITNYLAIKYLAEKGVNVKQIGVAKVDNFLLSSFNEYDTIIINQKAHKKSHDMVIKIIDYVVRNKIQSKLIFGTEVSWFAELKKGTFTQNHIDTVYSQATLLRHTAKTDQPIYSQNKENNIIEFEIGLDTELVKSNKCIDKRKYITFVCAPPDRTTKNNNLIDNIIERINKRKEFQNLIVKKVSPPYLTSELWSIYDQTKYLIFTSDSETFSYVLNDAKSKGVITFFPEHMFNNNIASNFVVVSYPDSGIRYNSLTDLVYKMGEIENSPELARLESLYSREYVVKNFSLEAISDNWKKIILGRPLSINKCYILNSDYEFFESSSHFMKYLLTKNIDSVIVVKDGKNLTPNFDSFSFFDRETGVLFHKYIYNLMCISGRVRKYTRIDYDTNIVKFSNNADVVESQNSQNVLQFLSLYKRINKVEKFHASKSTREYFVNQLNIDISSI